MVLTCQSVNEILKSDYIQIKALLWYFTAVLFALILILIISWEVSNTQAVHGERRYKNFVEMSTLFSGRIKLKDII